ncbi:hypothetical protein PtrEW13061_002823, partial [Pyrenophora tritici-repentis]
MDYNPISYTTTEKPNEASSIASDTKRPQYDLSQHVPQPPHPNESPVDAPLAPTPSSPSATQIFGNQQITPLLYLDHSILDSATINSIR